MHLMKPDPHDLNACTCANLRKATRVVTQAYDAALRSTGLTASQFTLLATLSHTGAISMTALAGLMVMDRTTLTRNLRPLQSKGLVEPAPAEDQRVRRIALSEAGGRALAEAVPLWKAAQSRLVDGVGAARWAQLLADLQTVATGPEG